MKWRRVLRISLCSFLLLALLVGVLAGWYGRSRRIAKLDESTWWRPSGGWVAGGIPYSNNVFIDTSAGHAKFIQKDAKRLHTWVRYGFNVDVQEHPVIVFKYRATNVLTDGARWYTLWMDDGTGPSRGGFVVFQPAELTSDGKVHELRKDLREFDPQGAIVGMALAFNSNANPPASLEILELHFESAPFSMGAK